MAATAADLNKINTTLISLMKHLEDFDQQMVEHGKKIDSMSGDLRDTMEQVRAHKLVNGISQG
jgi:DNA anti-recombination protein RmuC